VGHSLSLTPIIRIHRPVGAVVPQLLRLIAQAGGSFDAMDLVVVIPILLQVLDGQFRPNTTNTTVRRTSVCQSSRGPFSGTVGIENENINISVSFSNAFHSVNMKLKSLLAFSFLSTLIEARCVPDGPLLPRPTDLATSRAVKMATSNLEALLNDAVKEKLNPGWPVANVSFSVALVSQSDANSIWQYHHLAKNTINGTKHINGESQYLIGSVSKVFTDLLLLKSGINLNDPITKYLTELRSETSPIRWEEVTMAALGGHLSGMPQMYGFPEIYHLIKYYEAFGFPHLRPEDFPKCGVIGLNKGCTKEQLLDGLLESKPVAAANLRPAYSSMSFTRISYALQNVTGKNYSQLLREETTEPLGLASTFPSPGEDARAVVPPVENYWGAEYGDNAPGGGLVSTTDDLSRFAQAILSGAALGSKSKVLKWLKPASITTSLKNLVGLPWEIYRTEHLTPARPHTVDLYTKDGAAPGYLARFILIEQYGVGIVILTAGSEDPLAEAVLATLVPAVEEETRSQANEYVGNFSTPFHTSLELATNLSLSIDDGPGLKLDYLFHNNSNILDAIKAIWDGQLVNLGPLSPEFRIYPSDITWQSTLNVSGTVKQVIEEDWRLSLQPLRQTPASELPSQGVYEDFCATWQTGDTLYYGGQPLDRFVLVRDEEGVMQVRVPFLRSGIGRVD
jgi:CubicO group peptidase (beta-lactamase class C family)